MRGTRWQGACFKAFQMAFNLLIKTQTSIKCQLNCRRQWRGGYSSIFSSYWGIPKNKSDFGGDCSCCHSSSAWWKLQPAGTPGTPQGPCCSSRLSPVSRGQHNPKKHAKTSQAMHSPSPHVPLLTWVRMRLQSTAENETFCTSKNSFLQLINGWKNTTQANCIQLSSSQ